VAELRWYELFPPRDLSIDDVTAMTRVLAGRPTHGWRRLQPAVVLELWLSRQQARWLLGCESAQTQRLPLELSAQVAGFSMTPLRDSPRRHPLTGRELQLSSLTQPLRLDIAPAVAAGVLAVRHRLSKDEQAVVSVVVGPSQRFTKQPSRPSIGEQLGFTAPRPIDARDERAWTKKLVEPLFGVRLRVAAVAADESRAMHITGSLVSALSLLNTPHARLRARRPSGAVAEQVYAGFSRPRTWSSLVNGRELACLLALPIDGVPMPGKLHELSPAPRTLLIPISKPKQADGDRVLGLSLHPRDGGALVRLPVKSSFSHCALTGPTGSGKSTLLATMLQADMEAGHSIFLLEPKNDLVNDVLRLVPPHRRDDVVIIEPNSDDSRPVVGWNPLAGLKHDAERRADSMLHLFRTIFGSAIGPRSADLLLHALIMAARLDDGSLADVVPLLTNDAYRRRVLAKVSDPLIIAPWAAGFDALTEPERTRVVMPVLNKLRAFLNRAPVRRLVAQGTPRFDLDELFNSPKIVLVSLNAGLIGMETVKIVGATLLDQLWGRIQRQAGLPANQRRPVMAVIDELSDFVGTLDFAEVTAKARSANVSFTVAHQHLRQLSPDLRAALSANARNRISYRPAPDDTKALADSFGVSPDTLQSLSAYEAVAQVLVDNTPSAPFGVKTLPSPSTTSDPQALRADSAARYGVNPKQLDADLLARWHGGAGPNNGPIGMTRRPAK